MKLKFWYGIVLITFIISSISFLLCRDQILFYLYGYNQGLINSVTPNSFKAHQQVSNGRIVFLLTNIVLSIICLLFTKFMQRRNLNNWYSFILELIYIICSLVFIILVVGLVVSFNIPKTFF